MWALGKKLCTYKEDEQFQHLASVLGVMVYCMNSYKVQYEIKVKVKFCMFNVNL